MREDFMQVLGQTQRDDERESVKTFQRAPWRRYVFAILITVIALGARLYLLDTAFDSAVPFLFFYTAVILSALHGGFGPGLLTTVLSAAAVKYSFLEPPHSWYLREQDFFKIGLFLILGAIVSALCEALIRSRYRLEIEKEQMRNEVIKQEALKEELRKNSGLLHAVQSMAHVGGWELSLDNPDDIHSNPLHWLDETFRVFGYSPGEVKVTTGLFFSLVHPDDREAVMKAVSAAVQQRRHYEIEHRIIRSDGKERVIHEWADVITDGQPVRLLGACQDITEPKRYEEKINRLNTALKERVGQLERLQSQLKENDRRKDEFMAMLAHELRNPLAPVSNALHIMESPSFDSKTQKEAVIMANRQVSHMVRLLDDLLDVSRITHGKIVLQRKQADLCDVIRATINTSKPLMDAKSHSLQVNMPPCPIWVNGDETRLAQLFGNLLNNAAKYSGNGGHISIYAATDKTGAVIRVKDDGIGIARDKLPYIFDMFMQVDSSMERAQGGLGIGLMLVKRIAELHGGSIKASSEGKGKGTEFIVKLPIMEAAQQAQERKSDSPLTPSPHPYRILVVDDNVASAKTLGWMLEALGHEARLAFDARSAVKEAHSFQPDVVLLDIGLPDMNGYDVCRTMRNDPALKHSVFIAQTGWGQEQHFRQSQEAGFDYHLIKPVNIEALQQQLEKISSRRQQ